MADSAQRADFIWAATQVRRQHVDPWDLGDPAARGGYRCAQCTPETRDTCRLYVWSLAELRHAGLLSQLLG